MYQFIKLVLKLLIIIESMKFYIYSELDRFLRLQLSASEPKKWEQDDRCTNIFVEFVQDIVLGYIAMRKLYLSVWINTNVNHQIYSSQILIHLLNKQARYLKICFAITFTFQYSKLWNFTLFKLKWTKYINFWK